jgi:hypothetical protein
MKNDKLYPLYINFLDERLKEGKLNKGSYSLLKMSRTNFEDFKTKLEKDDLFEGEQIKNLRDRKIDDIFDDIN